MDRGTTNRGTANRAIHNRGTGANGQGSGPRFALASPPGPRTEGVGYGGLRRVAQKGRGASNGLSLAANGLITFFERARESLESKASGGGQSGVTAEKAREIYQAWKAAYEQMDERLSNAGMTTRELRLRLKAAYEGAARALDSSIGPVVKAEQAAAEGIVAEIRRHYRKMFGKISHQVGGPVRVSVVADFEFEAAGQRDFQRQVRDEVQAIVRYDPAYAKRQLSHSIYGASRLPARLRNLGPNTRLTPSERYAIKPTRRPDQQRSAGFYSRVDKRFYIRVGQTSLAVIAHELAHAYTHPRWDAALLKLSALTRNDSVWLMDEAVASEVADVVLSSQHTAASGGGPSFGGHPSGYVGYGPEVRKAGRRFLSAVEGSLSPGRTTAKAFFAGRIDIKTGRDPLVEFVGAHKSIRASVLLVR